MHALTLLVLSASAWAEPVGPPDGETQIPFGCEPAPIPGTVQYGVAKQARETNAQMFSAASFAERVVFPRLERSGFGDEHIDGRVWAFELNAVYGAAYVPSHELGSGCPEDFSYIAHRVDLFGSSTGLGFRMGPFSAYYVASVTGSMYATRLGSGFAPYAYGLASVFMGYLAPLQLDFLNQESETGSRATDYIAGTAVDMGRVGAVRAGYIGSKGAYLQANGKLLRLFGAVGIKNPTKLGDVPYYRAGLDGQPWAFGDDDRMMIGNTSLYARRQRFELPESFALAGASKDADFEFETRHIEQKNIGMRVDLEAIIAVEEDRRYAHQLFVAGHTPGWHTSKRILDPGIDLDEFGDDEIFGANGYLGLGMVELPDVWYLGVEGGRRFSLTAEGFLAVPTTIGEGAVLLAWSVRINDAQTLAVFPSAVNAVNHYFTIQVF